MKKLIWRLRYTTYGQQRCPIGWRNWWGFSAAYIDDEYEDHPHEVVEEEITYMTD